MQEKIYFILETKNMMIETINKKKQKRETKKELKNKYFFEKDL
jgi:hypothetical protein